MQQAGSDQSLHALFLPMGDFTPIALKSFKGKFMKIS